MAYKFFDDTSQAVLLLFNSQFLDYEFFLKFFMYFIGIFYVN